MVRNRSFIADVSAQHLFLSHLPKQLQQKSCLCDLLCDEYCLNASSVFIIWIHLFALTIVCVHHGGTCTNRSINHYVNISVIMSDDIRPRQLTPTCGILGLGLIFEIAFCAGMRTIQWLLPGRSAHKSQWHALSFFLSLTLTHTERERASIKK